MHVDYFWCRSPTETMKTYTSQYHILLMTDKVAKGTMTHDKGRELEKKNNCGEGGIEH